MDVLMIAHLSGSFSKGDNDRFKYIANLLCKAGHDVELVTSDFEHHKKKYRGEYDKALFPFKITTLHEPQYSKNVSISRMTSHYSFARKVKKYLNDRNRPDVIYCSIPPLETAMVASKFANKNGIKFIIDVQDLWPESFKMVFKVPIISDILFMPMTMTANMAYKGADEILAVSQTYVERALKVNRKCNEGYSIYLGTDLQVFDQFVKKIIINKPECEIWVTYIGNIGHSYDLKSIIDALLEVSKNGINNIKFIVIGDGPLKEEYDLYAKKNDLFCEFKGKLDYGEMAAIISHCDIAVNPIKKGTAASIVNKVGDYAAAGLPVINTQENEEYRKIVNEYKIGFNCKNGDSQDIAQKITCLYESKELREKMGRNNRKLAEERFDRNITYNSIVSLLQKS